MPLPMSHLVTCTRKAGHEVTHLGGGTASQPWLIKMDAAIAGIESGTWVFYVAVENQVGPLVIVRRPNGDKVLKSRLDGNEPTSLLALPDCPPGWGSLW